MASWVLPLFLPNLIPDLFDLEAVPWLLGHCSSSLLNDTLFLLSRQRLTPSMNLSQSRINLKKSH